MSINNESILWAYQICELRDASSTSYTSNVHNTSKRLEIDKNVKEPHAQKRTKRVERLTLAVFQLQKYYYKRTDLEDFIHNHSIDILMGSESHLAEKRITTEIVYQTSTQQYAKIEPMAKGCNYYI